jgi:ribonuclease HI/exonuclease III
MPNTNELQNICIWQQNVNKSSTCQHDLISSGKLLEDNINIIALQEPAVNFLGKSIASKEWITLYPTNHSKNPDKSRSIILLRATLCTDNWMQIDFPSSDVTVLQLTGAWGTLNIFNIYNDCNHNNTISALSRFQREHANTLERTAQGTTHTIWLGDFNRHHPHWDNPNDTRLFTNKAIRAAEALIEATADAGLDLALPQGIPTHIHNVTKMWTRLDHVFISDHSLELISVCDTVTSKRGINTDHLPILTKLNLDTATAEETTTHNFRDVDWEEFNNELQKQLTSTCPVTNINTQTQLNSACDKLTKALQNTIQKTVPISRICSKSKRWWTKELTTLRRQADKLGRKASKLSHLPYHYLHAEHSAAVKVYRTTLENTKRQHWRDWLERAEDPDIWTVNKLINSQPTDGGKNRIPALTHKIGDEEHKATTNDEKSSALARSFFPRRPPLAAHEDDTIYTPCCEADRITKDNIERQLKRLKPYKAPGPDGIPNIVLTKCANLLSDRLLRIYTAIYENRLLYDPWKHFTTVVLRKPGKPRYDIPKAYRPIALLNTLWKVLAGIIAEHLTYYTEKYQLLPDHHFGGRPSRTTTDALHLLTYRTKDAWRKRKVASVLFLDIEGAFPNAVPEKLIRNMNKRGVPTKIINLTANMLTNRETRLRFDDHTSDAIPINNGIGQGDPLSMGLYQYYNADLLSVPTEANQLAIAYVDDAIIFASGNTFEDTHRDLVDMMTKENGVIEWSLDHNSPLEFTKLALIDFSHHSKRLPRPPLILPHGTVEPQASAKYLGVYLDQHLNWAPQRAYVVEKGTSWAAQIKRIARPSWGITPNYARRLYIGVALPRILYGSEVWYHPSPAPKWKEATKMRGTVKVTKKLTSVQRAGALAITGGLRTSPTDSIDALAFLLPFALTIDTWCYRAALRLASLPDKHPLRKPVNICAKSAVKKHLSPLHNLLRSLDANISEIDTKPTKTHNPSKPLLPPFTVSIPPDKESSKREAQTNSDEIQVFSDGSIMDDKVGAAAILTRPNKVHRTLHLHLGKSSEYTIYDAELAGLLLGIHLIKTEKKARCETTLGADNQAAITAVHNELSTPAHYLARHILRTATQIQKTRGNQNYALTLRWTAGHVGIDGNELVDTEAKNAAKGQSSNSDLLPYILRRKLKISTAALKQNQNKRSRARWKKTWNKSKRGIQDQKIDPNTPSKKFAELISNSKLDRQVSSIISQLRTSHVPLNNYLFRFKRVDNPRCPACGEDSETVEHYLLKCPTYAHERWALEKSLKSKPTIKTLLGDRTATVALAKYIKATHRFDSLAQPKTDTHTQR